jgi:gamma-polyglutamate biosynthesis protein CapA
MGQQGLEQTRTFLKEASIGYMGDPLTCSVDLAYSKENYIFAAFNKISASGCSDEELLATVTDLRQQNPDKFLIVFMHWGNEYKTINSLSQQKLGHALIDAGVDLIIGSHPHVVQNIEQYKNKLIFYSLGNFIFDQYFSKNVQQGLAIGLEISADKITYNLYPLQSKVSQMSLMTEIGDFLANLAKGSSPDLKDSIEAGKIEIPK